MSCHVDCWLCWQEWLSILQTANRLLLFVHLLLFAWTVRRWWLHQAKSGICEETLRRVPLSGLNVEGLLLASTLVFLLVHQQSFGHQLEERCRRNILDCQYRVATADARILQQRSMIPAGGAKFLPGEQIHRQHRSLVQRFGFRPPATRADEEKGAGLPTPSCSPARKTAQKGAK